jgi:hypothetical protein
VELNDPVALILRHKGSQVYCITSHATVNEALEKLTEKTLGAYSA